MCFSFAFGSICDFFSFSIVDADHFICGSTCAAIKNSNGDFVFCAYATVCTRFINVMQRDCIIYFVRRSFKSNGIDVIDVVLPVEKIARKICDVRSAAAISVIKQ